MNFSFWQVIFRSRDRIEMEILRWWRSIAGMLSLGRRNVFFARKACRNRSILECLLAVAAGCWGMAFGANDRTSKSRQFSRESFSATFGFRMRNQLMLVIWREMLLLRIQTLCRFAFSRLAFWFLQISSSHIWSRHGAGAASCTTWWTIVYHSMSARKAFDVYC